MIGPLKLSLLDEPITVSLYAERGRPSIDPVVFFKLELVMFCQDLVH
jgi:hypothetical protein